VGVASLWGFLDGLGLALDGREDETLVLPVQVRVRVDIAGLRVSILS
jgi:hypothetical protein